MSEILHLEDDSVTSKEASAGSRRRGATALFVVGSCGESPRMAVRLNGELTVGRGRIPDSAVHDSDAKVILLADRLLSRRHLRIQTRAGGYEVGVSPALLFPVRGNSPPRRGESLVP